MSPPPLPPFPPLINPKHHARHANQAEQIEEAQRLRLKHALQRREVDDQQLAHQTARNSEIEHFVAVLARQADFAAEHAFAGRAAGEGIEHVEKHELREGERGVARGDGVGEHVFGGEVGDVGE